MCIRDSRDLAQLPGGPAAAFRQVNSELAVILRILAPVHEAGPLQPSQRDGNRWRGDIEMVRKLFLSHAFPLIQQGQQMDLPGMEIDGAAEGKIPGEAEPDDLKKEPDREILVMSIHKATSCIKISCLSNCMQFIVVLFPALVNFIGEKS